MIVIGTAGHIDHGKSAVVKRLTGTDPDRLPEEKARGMTIDLGFAFFTTAEGVDIAFVDVPGHERFVRNMIAGAGGVDAVMLVIAADDGWMPQSQEHFQITRLLGVKKGVIVVNKIDLVEPDWLALLEEEVRDKVTGSYLAEAPIFMVSSETGEGFEALADYLNDFPHQVDVRNDIGKARLYIDRSFVRPGIGGVVTGTLRGGNLDVGQTVLVWPAMVTGKIRTLQSQNENLSRVEPGHRTAVSFTGVDRELLVRGGVITDRTDAEFFVEHPVLALSLDVLAEAPVPMSDRRRANVIIGTTEIEGEVRIFDKKEVRPGENGIVFFKPDTPFYTLVGDHYIMRLPTPMVTLGGGLVLDHLNRFPRRKQLETFMYLKTRVSGNIPDLILSELEKHCLVRSEHLLGEADVSAEEVDREAKQLVSDDRLGRFREFVYHSDRLDSVASQLKERISAEFADNPHIKGLSLDRIQSLTTLPADTLMGVVQFMMDRGMLVRTNELLDLAGRSLTLKGLIKQAYEEIMHDLKANPFAPTSLSQLAGRGKNHQQAIKYIIDSGEGYKCGADFIFLLDVWNETVRFIRDRLDQSGSLAVSELRERFGYTRKYAIPILEETDRLGITRREGDVRVRGEV